MANLPHKPPSKGCHMLRPLPSGGWTRALALSTPTRNKGAKIQVTGFWSARAMLALCLGRSPCRRTLPLSPTRHSPLLAQHAGLSTQHFFPPPRLVGSGPLSNKAPARLSHFKAFGFFFSDVSHENRFVVPTLVEHLSSCSSVCQKPKDPLKWERHAFHSFLGGVSRHEPLLRKLALAPYLCFVVPSGRMTCLFRP